MKKDTVSRKLKVILIILFIVLISLISFGGIFVQKAKNYENILPEYLLGMDLSGARHITLTVSDETEDVIYDKDGNVVVPDSPNAYKFEAFLFDAFESLDDMVIMRVKREEEFAPVKNKEGVDSPETAIALYKAYYNII